MNDSSLDQASLISLSQQSVNNLSWVIFSPPCLLSNLLIILTIAKSKKLRNKSQFVILSQATADVLYSLAYLITGLFRYVKYLYQIPDTSTQFVCILKLLPLSIGGRASLNFTTFLAIDRFMCIIFPIFYRTRSFPRYIAISNFLVWTLCALTTLPILITFDPNKRLPVCTLTNSFDPGYLWASSLYNQILVPTTIGLYLVSCCVLIRRYKMTKLANESERSEWRRRMDLDAFYSMMTIGLVYALTFVGSTVTTDISRRYASFETTLRLGPLSTSFAFVGSLSHLFVYLWLNKTFREAFLKLFRKQGGSGEQVRFITGLN